MYYSLVFCIISLSKFSDNERATDGTGIFAVLTLHDWNEKRAGYFLYSSEASTLKVDALTVPIKKTMIHRILLARI